MGGYIPNQTSDIRGGIISLRGHCEFSGLDFLPKIIKKSIPDSGKFLQIQLFFTNKFLFILLTGSINLNYFVFLNDLLQPVISDFLNTYWQQS